MKRIFISLYVLLLSFTAFSQHQAGVNEGWKEIYRATEKKINDLVHTKLDVKFDYNKSYMYGKAWITLKPHFYPTDSLRLDAKGMDIYKVAVVKAGKNIPLQYKYDGMSLNISLDKVYKGGENYTVYIDYVSKPDELKVQGSAAITDAKGLYFINPKGEDKNKPTQIWTQGETEATSVWCPTIDKPNQKTTQEISMTVPSKYVTLSNGKLVSKKTNTDGNRTDTWKMDLPHAPYLFFMGVGDFAVVKDSYKGKEVSYYVEKEYEKVARKIFGNTPEMMKFFSEKLGVEYPWNKYSQIVGRDYVSGAMENTTTTLHQESAQQDARELVDGNSWEPVIAHELFHHWFGDLVTTESWGNLTVNESFANYSETLWDEYKYGKDAGDHQNFSDMQGYLHSQSENKHLVRFHYKDKEDMFDAVSYQKGGRILHMLRNYVGDEAFFKALNLYLIQNKFKSAEAHQLRLAFEEVTGQDLNWFWNQWYYGSGHPKLDINYNYDANKSTASVTIKQTQGGKVFQLPFAVDIYHGSKKQRHQVWMTDSIQTFSFAVASKPDLINVDGDKVLLCQKTDNKTIPEYIHQYKYAGNYLDRREAIDACAKKQDNTEALIFLKTALKDKYWKLRSYAIGKLDLKNSTAKEAVEPILLELAKSKDHALVRAKAINTLGKYKKNEYAYIFQSAIKDSSYSVAGNALEALAIVDSIAAFNQAKLMIAHPAKGKLSSAMTNVFVMCGDENQCDFVVGSFEKMPLSEAKLQAVKPVADFLSKVNNTEKVKRGVDAIVDLRNQIPAAYRGRFDGFFGGMILPDLMKKKEIMLKDSSDKAAIQQQIEYIKAKAEMISGGQE